MTTTKQKPTITKVAIHIALVGALMFFVIWEMAYLYRSPPSLKERPKLYEKHFTFNDIFPYVGNFYLLKPLKYDPQKKYPLVISLHTEHREDYVAAFFSKERFRENYSFFVMIPIAPARAAWLSPNDKTYQLSKFLQYPDHMPHVIDGIEEIEEKYNIDNEKIILAGHSMGASGVVGALQKHPQIFSIGIATAAKWAPKEITNINKPLLMYHGLLDQIIPVKHSTELSTLGKIQGKPIEFTIMRSMDHNIGDFVYGNPNTWERVLKHLN